MLSSVSCIEWVFFSVPLKHGHHCKLIFRLTFYMSNITGARSQASATDWYKWKDSGQRNQGKAFWDINGREIIVWVREGKKHLWEDERKYTLKNRSKSDRNRKIHILHIDIDFCVSADALCVPLSIFRFLLCRERERNRHVTFTEA